jgi:hypothetical protein
MTEPVTIYAICYGESYETYLPAWIDAVERLDPAPADVVLVTDRRQKFPWRQIVAPRTGRYPYTAYLNAAVAAADTDHVATVDIDDEIFPDALAGTDYSVDVYVWGLERSDGLLHFPVNRSAEEVLSLDYNPFNHGGVHTVDIWRRAGRFRDIGYLDWGFFLDCARVGATFGTSGRANYRYLWHPDESVMGPLLEDHERHAAEARDPNIGRVL